MKRKHVWQGSELNAHVIVSSLAWLVVVLSSSGAIQQLVGTQ